ncbi:divalent cation transporter [Thiohalobacter sp. COW1]|uniref:ZIP family metal transporter n=1 Tax=Thiohalobacter sp. COW1 TaxID=2795687 RepID=UPI001915F500|nr:divalent cation transporter [Thiohalobacter sp. COW1]BCO32624.1 divalent cation transporter [Thiohalobacter sp. COW1]
MDELARILIYTAAAGLCIPLGGLLACIEHIQPRWLEREFRHFVIAFGGGILLGAVALVLIPEGMQHFNGSLAGVGFLILGGLIFFQLERWLGVHRRESPQLLGMLLDYIPESVALGGMFAVGSGSAALFAFFIGMQNLPEGFNAYRELIHGGRRRRHVLLLMLALAGLGPLVGLLGWALLADSPYALGAIMLTAAGGILYLIFQDIAPQSRLDRHWAPPLGAIFGFAVGLTGHALMGGA